MQKNLCCNLPEEDSLRKFLVSENQRINFTCQVAAQKNMQKFEDSEPSGEPWKGGRIQMSICVHIIETLFVRVHLQKS